MKASCDTMTKVILDSKVWVNLLSSLGENITDVVINASAPSTIEYHAAHSTYYVHYKVTHENSVKRGGNLTITDMKKTLTFLKNCKGDVTVQQSVSKLSLKCNNKKMTIPLLNCKSAQLAPTMSSLVENSRKGQWIGFGRGTFTTHGTVNFGDLIDGAKIAKSLSVNSEFLIKSNAEEKELILHAFKTGGTSIICNTEIKDAQGPNHTTSSSFGSWLLGCLTMLDGNVDSTIHCGDSMVLAIEQSGEGWERTIIVLDQDVA